MDTNSPPQSRLEVDVMQPATILRPAGRVVLAALWLAFPVVPLLAEDTYFSLCTLQFFSDSPMGPDPHEWGAGVWAMMLGPLCGYGFLAGATWGVADEAGVRWWRAVWSRRAVWVGLGPWLGLWTLWAAGLAIGATRRALSASGVDQWSPSASMGPVMAWGAGFAGLAWLCLGWLPVARAALRRAGRAGRIGGAWRAGLGLAATFVGSLFGGYWAVTTAWRDYFFDPTLVP